LNDDDDMPRARPQFMHLSEAEVWEAIAEDDCGSIGAEVTRLVAEFTIRLMACADRHGHAPGCGMQVRVRCPIEHVAVLMMVEGGASVSTVH
jgi:hypothetical protein